MKKKKGPAHVVVDGSNIATEGRSAPSLAQLNEAVTGFMSEHPDTAVTVVVDATFGHRIDKKERKEFEEGIANNELVAPPAGAVGRGDAFVLGIADKAGATVLSNDSFQEFHGQYDWLFDQGRLVGGKPVPHVGWVWVDRVPVRGPVSRKATRSAQRPARAPKAAGKASKAASGPMPVPTAPPPGASSPTDDGARRPAPKGKDPVNELIPFLEFVEHHPIGTSVNGTVDAYSSHGAYLSIGDDGVRGYVPLRLMADPPPRSAKSVMKIGESVTVVVVHFAAARRSIDCALPDVAERAIAELADDDDLDSLADAGGASTRTEAKRSAKKTTAKKTAATKAPAKKSPAKKTTAKKTTAKKTTAKKTAAKKTPAKKSTAKKSTAKKTPARKSTAKKTRAKKSATKRSGAKKAAASKSADSET